MGDLFRATYLDFDVHVSLRLEHEIGIHHIISTGTTSDFGSQIQLLSRCHMVNLLSADIDTQIQFDIDSLVPTRDSDGGMI
jgi:hypothetical protein